MDNTGNDNNTASKVRVFVLQTDFASPNRIDGSEDLTDMRREINFTYPKLKRNQIGAIRERHMKLIRDMTVNYPPNFKNPLHLCNEAQMVEIQAIAKQAEIEFQAVDKVLHANIAFVEINIHDVQRGDLYGQVIAAIRYKIMSELIERIGNKVGQLPEKGREAMLKMIDRLKSVNVLNDPEVEKQLNDVRDKILTQDLAAVKENLSTELNFTKQRMAYVNL